VSVSAPARAIDDASSIPPHHDDRHIISTRSGCQCDAKSQQQNNNTLP
jgi:hypothetical protein